MNTTEIQNSESVNTLYNLSKLTQMLDNNTTQINKMLTMFITFMPEHIKNMNMYLEEKNYEKLGFIVHKMKTAIDALDIETQKQAIREIYKICKEKNNIIILPTLVENLSQTINIIIDDLNNNIINQ